MPPQSRPAKSSLIDLSLLRKPAGQIIFHYGATGWSQGVHCGWFGIWSGMVQLDPGWRSCPQDCSITGVWRFNCVSGSTVGYLPARCGFQVYLAVLTLLHTCCMLHGLEQPLSFAVHVSFRLLNIRSQLHGPSSACGAAATVPKAFPLRSRPCYQINPTCLQDLLLSQVYFHCLNA